jgi:TetR/AcrR family transcriptional repressor of nem operon
MVERVTGYLPDPGAPNATATARTIVATLIGTVAMARAINDPGISGQLLADAQETLLAMARNA